MADLKLTPEAEDIIKQSSGKAAHMKCDVSKWSNLEAIPSEVEKAFGKGSVADVYVAGAGIFEPKWSSFLYDREDEFYMQMRINAEHPIKLTRLAMRSLLGANKPGVVLLIASMAGVQGIYAAGLYCASKHAVVGFTKSMGQADVDENVKIVCICPGMVATPLWTRDDAKHVREQFSYADDLCIKPEEVAQGMKEIIEEGKYPGGTLLEVSKSRARGPLATDLASVIEGQGEELKIWYDNMCKPLRDVFNSERGS